jgi:two-component system response regulator NreC
MENIRVVVADDHGILLEGLRLLLDSTQDVEVVAHAGSGFEALEKIREHRPDVILLDIAMPEINGLELISIIKSIAPDTRVVILSRYEKEAYVHQALSAGASGYVVKGAPSSELIDAIRHARSGKYFLSSQIQTNVIRSFLDNTEGQPKNDTNISALSEREAQIFKLLIEGNTSRQIANILCISSKTVDKHRTNIARKIGIDNPVKMLQFAVRQGLVDPEIWED